MKKSKSFTKKKISILELNFERNFLSFGTVFFFFYFFGVKIETLSARSFSPGEVVWMQI